MLDYLDPASRTDYIKSVFIISSLEAKAKEGEHYLYVFRGFASPCNDTAGVASSFQ